MRKIVILVILLAGVVPAHALLTRQFVILGVSDTRGNFPQMKEPIIKMLTSSVERITADYIRAETVASNLPAGGILTDKRFDTAKCIALGRKLEADVAIACEYEVDYATQEFKFRLIVYDIAGGIVSKTREYSASLGLELYDKLDIMFNEIFDAVLVRRFVFPVRLMNLSMINLSGGIEYYFTPELKALGMVGASFYYFPDTRQNGAYLTAEIGAGYQIFTIRTVRTSVYLAGDLMIGAYGVAFTPVMTLQFELGSLFVSAGARFSLTNRAVYPVIEAGWKF